MRACTRIAVVGVGNEFRRDDGVGWAVVARLRERATRQSWPPDVVLATCDGDPARLIGLWEDVDLAVVVDAAHAHPGTPGRVHRLALRDARLSGPTTTSSHGLGLGEAVELARVLGLLPRELVVYAVEGADSDFGTGLSPAVAAAVDPLADAVESSPAARQPTESHRPSNTSRPKHPNSQKATTAYEPTTSASPSRFRSTPRSSPNCSLNGTVCTTPGSPPP